MATVLDRKYTEDDATPDILRAIHTLATDANHRMMPDDELVWRATKLGEIARLTGILIARTPDADGTRG